MSSSGPEQPQAATPSRPDDAGAPWAGLPQLASDTRELLALIADITGGPGTATSHREQLQERLGTMRAGIDYVAAKNKLDWAAINRQRDRTRSRYEEPHTAASTPPAARKD
jgi:hypothetical protein